MLLLPLMGVLLTDFMSLESEAQTHLVLGEVHGIRGNVTTIETTVVETASTRPVALALELPADAQDVFDAYWSGPEERLSTAQIQAMGWCAIEDGRVSVDLVDMLGALKTTETAYPISVHLYVDETGFGGEFQTIASRSNYASILRGVALRDLALTQDEARVIASLGNFHANRAISAYPEAIGGGETLRAGHILGDGFETVMLTYDAGQRVGCGLDGCGVISIPGSGQSWSGFDRTHPIGAAEAVQPLSTSPYCADVDE